MKKIFIYTLLLSLVLFSALTQFAQTKSRLFQIKSEPARASENISPAAVRESEIALNLSAVGTSFEIPLFDGKAYRVDRLSNETRRLDDFTFHGSIKADKFEGDVILTFRGGFVSGLIYAPKAVYEIVPRGSKQFLVELDQSLFPECGGGIVSDENESLKQTLVPEAMTDSGDRIDVLVVYTTATKNLLGGDPQAQTLAQQAIDATNAAYFNSKIRQRARLVHSQEYVYTETASASTDLSNLRANASIAVLRDTHKADLVAMIGEISGACGIGYLMGSGSPNNGYTATARSCAVGNLSFAHELGHNMGSHHNPENGGTASYPYSFGHYINGSYRTVMSYVDPCPNGCARVPYFSNPSVIHLGFPAGIENARDNARSINNTADAISNYRYSGSNLMLENFSDASILPRGIRRNLLWSSDNLTGNVRIEISRDEGRSWQTVVADTPNDGNEGITLWGNATKRARIRIVSISNSIVSDSSIRNIAIR
ncbi:MAG: reprolysin-like metallopeptidase [Blastocatellia bacterium]